MGSTRFCSATFRQEYSMAFRFTPEISYTTGNGPHSVISADVNGDGKLDLVTANQTGNDVSVLLGIGDGTFGAQVTYAVGTTPQTVISIDANGDGKLDLVTLNRGDSNVSVLLGLGDGTFGTQSTYAVGGSLLDLTSGDVNGDGKPDLIATGGQGLWVLLGAGGGAFSSPTAYSVGFTSSATSADVNGDGKLDLIAANQTTNVVSTLLGNGDGTFGTQTSFAVGSAPVSVITADVNRDGKLDLIATNVGDNSVSVLLGTGAGTFGAQTSYAVGRVPSSVTSMDFNGDGELDLVTANANDNSVSVLLGTGTGTFGAQLTYASGSNPRSVVSADFNGDGKSDLSVTGLNRVSVLLGENTDTVTSITATTSSGSHLKAGDEATFTLNTDAPVVVTGTPQLTLSNGGLAIYGGVDANGKPQFVYHVSAGDQDTSDLVITGLDLNGGTITAPSQTSLVRHDVATEPGPTTVNVADVNDDGKADLIVVNYDSRAITVQLGNGDGTFGNAATFADGFGALDAKLADINGDGKLDIVAAADNNVAVLIGDGSGSFVTQTTSAVSGGTGGGTLSLALADVNGDGKLDLITANRSHDNVSVLLGNGDGTFAAQTTYGVGSYPQRIVAADVNDDGKIDLITANSNSDNVSVLIGLGNGAFSTQVTYAVGNFPRSVISADVNGDGKLDLVTSNYSASTVSVLLGTGTGTFLAQNTYAISGGPGAVAIIDIDGDGKLDLVSSDYGSNAISVLLGDGAGSFGSEIIYAVGVRPQAVISADVNGDGAPDIIAPNTQGSSVSVLLNTSTPPSIFDPSSIAIATGADTHISIDNVAPNAPSMPDLVAGSDSGTFTTDNQTNVTTPTFTGTAEVGSTITLYDTDGNTVLGTVVATDGTWSITASTLSEGHHAVSATASDAVGNVSLASSSLDVTIDTTASTLSITSDVSQLKVGETATITFTFSDDPGATFAWDGSSGDIIVSGGTLSAISGSGLVRTAIFTPAASTDSGTASITVASAVYTDVAGNDGGAGTTPSLHFDTLAPDAPSTPVLSTGSDSGTSSTDNLTKATTPTFTGTAEAGSTVRLYDTDGTTVLGTAVATGGTWSISTTTLTEGHHAISATATDAAGNTGVASSGLDVAIDTTAPTLTITSDVSQLKIGETATITFTFSEDPGSTFTWDGSSGDIAVSGGSLSAISGSGLVRTATFTPTAATDGGTASITVASAAFTDAAGNDGGAGTTPSLHFDTLAPNGPSTPDLAAGSDSGVSSTDNITSVTTPTFTGTAESGATVTLYDTDGVTVLGSAVAIGGNWSIVSSALGEGSHSISATATDAAGNASVLSTGLNVVIDTTAPNVTDDSYVTNEDTVLTIAAPGVLGNDTDSHAMTGAVVSGPAHGALTLNGDGSLTYTPDADFHGSDSFTYRASDSAGLSSVATVHLNVTAVNDAPTAINLTQSLTLAEDAAPVGLFTLAPVVDDIDSASVTATLTLSDPAAGVLVGAGTGAAGVYTVTGTVAAVNAALAAVTFDSAQDFNGSVNVAVAIGDGANGPQGTNPSGSVSITVTAVNDAPVNTVPGGKSTLANTNLAIAGLSVSDADATSLTSTLHVEHGTLTVAAVGGAVVGGNGTDTVTLTGTAAQIDAALGASNNVVYRSVAGFEGTDHLAMTTDDGGGTGSGGSLTDTDTVDIAVTAAIPVAGTPGADVFQIGNSLYAISNFASGSDHIQLGSNFVSEGGGPHPLGNAVHFEYGTVATGSGMTILYDAYTGTVFWDADGNGVGAPTKIATVQFTDAVTSQTLPGTNGYTALGTGDFNGDGTSDIIWKNNASGATEIWTMKNGALSSFTPIGNLTGYSLVGTGDFNGDGTSDIIWKNNASGATEIWTMKDGARSSFTPIGNLTGYSALGTGDFNGDGTSDIVWKNDVSGAAEIWLMKNGHLSSFKSQGDLSSYNLIGTGDVNGDGTSDLIWQNRTSGVAESWLMKNGYNSGGFTFGNLTGYQLLETADFNHDGTADLLWRSTSTGEVSDWIMKDGHFSGQSASQGIEALAFQKIGAGDFNHDGGNDVLWHDTATNTTQIWDVEHRVLTASDFLIV
jgi:Big-like domain-containing protein/VCBS repeat protein